MPRTNDGREAGRGKAPGRKLVFQRWVAGPRGKGYLVSEDCDGNLISRVEDRPRKPAVTVTAQAVTIPTEWHRRRRDDYAFATERIDSPLALVGWLHHLCEKVWFDRETAAELIEKVSDHFGWAYWNT